MPRFSNVLLSTGTATMTHPNKLFSFFRVLGGLVLLVALTGCSGKEGAMIEHCLEDQTCETVVEVTNISGEIPVDPLAPFWSSGKSALVNIELGPQMITNPKWPNPSIQGVRVRAVRNSSDIAIYVEWDDEQVDDQFSHSGLYSDKAALMFPLVPMSDVYPITMGADGYIVNIWQWKAIWEHQINPHPHRGELDGSSTSGFPERLSSIEDMNAEGYSTLTSQEEQNVNGKGIWKDKVWHLVFTRPLAVPDNADVQFKHSAQMAIAVWNGANRERNGQKGISSWILLRFS